MKCYVCNEEFWIEEVHQLFFYQHLCNNCNNLFQYEVKSVKISSLVCIVHFMKNYRNVLLFTNSDFYVKINTHLIDVYCRNKKYYTVAELKILLIEKRIYFAQKIVIFFYRNEYYKLLEVMSHLIEKKLTKRIVVYELIK